MVINMKHATEQLFGQYLKQAMDAAFEMETGRMHVALDKILKLGTDKYAHAVHKCNCILDAARQQVESQMSHF